MTNPAAPTPTDPPGETRKPSAASRLRAKAPELLFEAASIAFAVLLALAVDEWRDHRANLALAARARESILAEVRANRDEIAGGRSENMKVQAGLAPQITEIEAGRSKSINLGWQVAQLSSAAWQAAQSTQATQFMDYRWVVEAARLYELQRLYTTTQEDLVLRLGEISGDPLPLRVIQSRMELLASLDKGLTQGYAELLTLQP